MKRIFLAIVTCVILSSGLHAQENHMTVRLNDGSVIRYDASQVEEITFDEIKEDYGSVGKSHAVDLGLSVKWADMNVGAEKPEDVGGLYAWGETEVKEVYDVNSYKWYNGGQGHLTKYCTRLGLGEVDNKTVLDPEDDAASVNWGGNWRMPTLAELDELLTKCSWEGTSMNDHGGVLVTGPNGNSIFLPYEGLSLYWSASLDSRDCDDAFMLWLGRSIFISERYIGHNVRAVCP